MEPKHCPKCGHEPTDMDKWRWSFFTAILFLIIVNPMTYKFVQKLLGGFVKIADASGCPTTNGILVHALVFMGLVRGLMSFDI